MCRAVWGSWEKQEMDKNGLHDLIRASRTDRRAFNKHLASLGLASVAMPLVSGAAQSAGEINYFTWAGYEIPELHPAYIEKYGGSPETSFYADEEEALIKLRQDFAANVAHPCSTVIQRWYDAGVIKQFDTSRLQYWDDLVPALRDVPGTVVDGKPIFVANDWGSHSIAYRTDVIDRSYAEEKSWELLLDETYAGRLSMWDSVDAAVAFAGMILGIRDTTSVTDAQIEQMKEVLMRQKELLRSYWSVETDGEAMMSSGEVVASYFWSGPVYRMQDAGIPVEYMMDPKGGIITWECGLVLTNNGEGDEQAAYDFINAWNSPEAGKFLIEVYGYGHSNLLTYEIVDPEILKAMGLDGDIAEILAGSMPWQSWPPEVMARYVQMYEDVQLAE
jgi:spermidine/putrescine transport system substrate-binding protein